jgi:hypothetical protein
LDIAIADQRAQLTLAHGFELVDAEVLAKFSQIHPRLTAEVIRDNDRAQHHKVYQHVHHNRVVLGKSQFNFFFLTVLSRKDILKIWAAEAEQQFVDSYF